MVGTTKSLATLLFGFRNWGYTAEHLSEAIQHVARQRGKVDHGKWVLRKRFASLLTEKVAKPVVQDEEEDRQVCFV